MHSEVCSDTKGGKKKRMSGRDIIEFHCCGHWPTMFCKNSLTTAELIWMNFPLEFHVILPLKPLEPTAPNQLCQKALGCFFFFFAGELDGAMVSNVWKCFFYQCLRVLREQTSDKIPVVTHRTQFESRVSRSRAKIRNAASCWVLWHPTGWCWLAWLDSVLPHPRGHGSVVDLLQKCGSAGMLDL